MTFTDDDLQKYIAGEFPLHNEPPHLTQIRLCQGLAQALLGERQMKRVACHFGVSRSREATMWEDDAVALAQAILDAPHGPGCQILGCGHKWPSCARCWTGGVCTCWKAAVTELARRVVGDANS